MMNNMILIQDPQVSISISHEISNLCYIYEQISENHSLQMSQNMGYIYELSENQSITYPKYPKYLKYPKYPKITIFNR